MTDPSRFKAAAKIVNDGYDWNAYGCPEEYRDAMRLLLDCAARHAEMEKVAEEMADSIFCYTNGMGMGTQRMREASASYRKMKEAGG